MMSFFFLTSRPRSRKMKHRRIRKESSRIYLRIGTLFVCILVNIVIGRVSWSLSRFGGFANAGQTSFVCARAMGDFVVDISKNRRISRGNCTYLNVYILKD